MSTLTPSSLTHFCLKIVKLTPVLKAQWELSSFQTENNSYRMYSPTACSVSILINMFITYVYLDLRELKCDG